MAVIRSDTEYYDFVLIGKTGMGKSTLGNKLLQIEKVRHDSALHRITSTFVGLLRETALPYTRGRVRFVTTDDVSPDNADVRSNSVTDVCELLVNDELKVRVLDVPGFSDSGTLTQDNPGKSISVVEGNFQIIRWIVRVQAATNLRVRRVVYFLPLRGPPERADGNMQEELQVLHHFFGDAIFDCMVVIASNHRMYQRMGYDERSLQDSKTVFHKALKQATKNEKICCPPIVYIGLNEGCVEVTKKLQSAKVLKDEILQIKFRDNVCSRCSVGIMKAEKDKEVVCIVDNTGTKIDYKDSQCHPYFVQKYATWKKFVGGIGHMATLGTVAIASAIKGQTIWPGFTNSDEICPACRNSPGSPGCRKAGTEVVCDWPDPPKHRIQIDHTNIL